MLLLELDTEEVDALEALDVVLEVGASDELEVLSTLLELDRAELPELEDVMLALEVTLTLEL